MMMSQATSKFEQVGDCWIWQRQIDRDGYGRLSAKGRSTLAHRVTYEDSVGPIPDGLELDHLCRNRACCNPAHLQPVTHAENMRRAAGPRKTHCKSGHEFSPSNTYLRPTGQQQCRACNRAAAKRHRSHKGIAA